MAQGYDCLAKLMGRHPNVATFRRFGALNAQMLLYLQAELTHLEVELRGYEQENAESKDFKRERYSRHWQLLDLSAYGENPEQWNTVVKIQKTLKEYNQLLLTQSMIAKMEVPNLSDHRFLQKWMDSPSMGNISLLGADYSIWEDLDTSDLVTLNSRKSADLVTRVIADGALPLYHRLIGQWLKHPDTPESQQNTAVYSEVLIMHISSVVSTVLASMLPIASIFVLYFVVDMMLRLVSIAIFTAGFAISLGLLTGARPIEVFSATAAYAAVMVVFVSNNGPKS